MNRTIKFRVWDTDENIFRHDCSITSDGIPQSSWGKDKEHWVIQFATGLMDKHQNDIYEGDIVRGEMHEDGEIITGQIKFSPFKGYFIDNRLISTYEIMYDWGIDWATLEIIGDIFHNKELIK